MLTSKLQGDACNAAVCSGASADSVNCHAYALHFASYNLCRVHSSLRVMPAMADGAVSAGWPLNTVIS